MPTDLSDSSHSIGVDFPIVPLPLVGAKALSVFWELFGAKVRVSGLGLRCVVWVDEVPGSNPGLAPFEFGADNGPNVPQAQGA